MMPQRPIIQKRAIWRSRKYITFVKGLPCTFPGCHVEPCKSAHHAKGVGYLSGAGLTAPDWATMPLCLELGHHQTVQTSPEWWPHQWQWIVETICFGIDRGVLVMEPPYEFIARALGSAIEEGSR